MDGAESLLRAVCTSVGVILKMFIILHSFARFGVPAAWRLRRGIIIWYLYSSLLIEYSTRNRQWVLLHEGKILLTMLWGSECSQIDCSRSLWTRPTESTGSVCCMPNFISQDTFLSVGIYQGTAQRRWHLCWKRDWCVRWSTKCFPLKILQESWLIIYLHWRP